MFLFGEIREFARMCFCKPSPCPDLITAPIPFWNEPEHLKFFWSDAQASHSTRRLGTAGEALKTVELYEKLFRDQEAYLDFPRTGKRLYLCTSELRERLKSFQSGEVVGDTNSISSDSELRHFIGYVIEETSATDLQREVIEGLTQRIVLLRRDGCVISAYAEMILRHEQVRQKEFA